MAKLSITITYEYDVDDASANKVKELFEMASNPLQDCDTRVNVYPKTFTDPNNERGKAFVKALNEKLRGEYLRRLYYDLL